MLERGAELAARGHVRLAESWQVRSDEVKTVGEQRDQLAELVARRRQQRASPAPPSASFKRVVKG
jgi:hypothetical protein